jgi:hypothetical protein
MALDDKQLVKMSQEIAALLMKHLPPRDGIVLSSDTVHLKSQTCVQVFGFCLEHKAIFSLKAVLRRPPPRHLNLKCCTYKSG